MSDDAVSGGHSAGDPWSEEAADEVSDPASVNWFSDEIDSVNASDWEGDAADIWGDDGDAQSEAEPVLGLDFSL
jgi:hypothetical protein